MKKIILILLVIFMSCKNSNTKNKNNNEIDQDIEYVDLIEDFNRKDLTKPPYDSWFTENYNNYELDIEETQDYYKKSNKFLDKADAALSRNFSPSFAVAKNGSEPILPSKYL